MSLDAPVSAAAVPIGQPTVHLSLNSAIRGEDDGDDRARVRALSSLHILDTAPEERFDLIVRLAQRIFGVSSAAVSLIDEDRQWLKSKVGTDFVQGPRSQAFCDHTIRGPGPLVVLDPRHDERFRFNPAVVGAGGVRFYAGYPLTVFGDHRVGALCLWDTEPRELDDAELILLRDLAHWVERELVSDAELGRAAVVQQSLLPKLAPVIPGVEVAGGCFPAREVGGDFFDYYLIGSDLQVTIADVMGKGISAAIVAAGVRAVLRGSTRFNDVATAVNRAALSLEEDLTETSTFVTLFSARLAPDTGRFTYVDAGHGLSAVVRRSGALDQLASVGPPLGVVPGQVWYEQETDLGPGDTFISVSDGWLDYFDSVQQAATAAVGIVRSSSSAQGIVDAMGRFSAEHLATDDLTVVVLRKPR